MLVALIVLQSIAAIADAHQLHQTGSEHLEFDHGHDSTPVKKEQLAQKDPSAQFDCHHCCHCHGMSHLFLESSSCNIDIVQLGQDISEHRFAYFSYLISPDIRPPIV
jgi:hypothetical protein